MSNREGLTIILSGRLRNSSNFELGKFWESFIEIQRAIPQSFNIDNIFAHSFSVNQRAFIQSVYEPKYLIEEENKEHELGCLSNLDLSNIFNIQDNSPESSKNYLILKDMCLDIISRSKALNILERVPEKEASNRVLILDWQALSSRRENKRDMCIDASLPEHFIYMEYNKHVDLGYYDDWIYTSWFFAKELPNFASFTIDFIEKNSGKIFGFKKIKWPWHRYIDLFAILFSVDTLANLIFGIRDRARHIQKSFLNRDLFSRFIFKMATLSLDIVDSPNISVETSFVPQSKLGKFSKKIVFGKADRSKLFKSFIASNILLKDNLRLLTGSDFNAVATSGQLIAAQNIILIIELKLESDIEIVIKNRRLFLLPFEKFFVIQGEYIYDVDSFSEIDKDIVASLRKLGFKNKFKYIYNQLKSLKPKETPILFLNSFCAQNFCDDWIYLNSLLKFSMISKKRLVIFSNSIFGRKVEEFPDLQILDEVQELPLQNMILSRCFLGYLANSILENGTFKIFDSGQAEALFYISRKQIFRGDSQNVVV